MSDLVVKLNKTIHAPIEKVFDAWLDAEMLSRFMTPIAGMPQPRTEANGIQGGGFVIYMKVGEDEVPHRGTYLQVDRPNKLVFSWESPFSTDGSTVTIHFKRIDSDLTEIDFEHVKFIDEEWRNNHEGGWTTILQTLDDVIGVAMV